MGHRNGGTERQKDRGMRDVETERSRDGGMNGWRDGGMELQNIENQHCVRPFLSNVYLHLKPQ